MQREHIAEGWWQLPGKPQGAWPGTKNGRDHRVWLSEPAQALIESHLRRSAAASRRALLQAARRRARDRARHAARSAAHLPDVDHPARLRPRRDGPDRQSPDQHGDRRLRPPRLCRRGQADHGGGGAARDRSRRGDGDEQRDQPAVTRARRKFSPKRRASLFSRTVPIESFALRRQRSEVRNLLGRANDFNDITTLSSQRDDAWLPHGYQLTAA